MQQELLHLAGSVIAASLHGQNCTSGDCCACVRTRVSVRAHTHIEFIWKQTMSKRMHVCCFLIRRKNYWMWLKPNLFPGCFRWWECHGHTLKKNAFSSALWLLGDHLPAAQQSCSCWCCTVWQAQTCISAEHSKSKAWPGKVKTYGSVSTQSWIQVSQQQTHVSLNSAGPELIWV